MDVLELGESARPLRVKVKASGGWAATMRITPTSTYTFPEGTTVVLRITARDGRSWTWPAVVTDTTVSWSVSATAATSVPPGADAKVILTVPGSDPVEWFDGAVVRA